MELKDLIVTPVFLSLVLLVCYLLRPALTNATTRAYYFPAVIAKIIGALAVGFIYQFYYGGGDTFNFFTHGSKHIWEAFLDEPSKGFSLIFAKGTHAPETFRYSSQIWFFKDPSSYIVIRFSAILGLLTFHTYSSNAILFAMIAFSGQWAMFKAFVRLQPHLSKPFAIAILFIPSVVFWGSGLLKDTLTLAALCWASYAFVMLFFFRKNIVLSSIILVLSLWLMAGIKVYILLSFLPALIFWLFLSFIKKIESVVLRWMLAPFILAVGLGFGYLAIDSVGSINSKYSLEKIGETAAVTAYDIRFWTGKDAGSGYYLGELDGSIGSMLKIAPAAVNVSLFRPYLWEVKNPIMALSALESLIFLILTLSIVLSPSFYRNINYIFSDPMILFCLTFSIIFAFAVGSSTFNFGSLVRYKIPLMPFFTIALLIIRDRIKIGKEVSGKNKKEELAHWESVPSI